MPAPTTYSFLDVLATIVGPGGSFNLGTGAGPAPEGITVESPNEIDKLEIGADGSPMHSLIADKSAKVTIRLLKTSPVNAQLAAMMALQRADSASHGQNTITVMNKSSGDSLVCQQSAFAKPPTLTYATEAGMNEWEFNVGIYDPALGAGVG